VKGTKAVMVIFVALSLAMASSPTPSACLTLCSKHPKPVEQASMRVSHAEQTYQDRTEDMETSECHHSKGTPTHSEFSSVSHVCKTGCEEVFYVCGGHKALLPAALTIPAHTVSKIFRPTRTCSILLEAAHQESTAFDPRLPVASVHFSPTPLRI
jgi:hypothetical protein